MRQILKAMLCSVLTTTVTVLLLQEPWPNAPSRRDFLGVPGLQSMLDSGSQTIAEGNAIPKEEEVSECRILENQPEVRYRVAW